MEYREFKTLLETKVINNTDANELASFLESTIQGNELKSTSYRKAFFSVLKDMDTTVAIEAVKPAIDTIDSLKFLSSIKRRTETELRRGAYSGEREHPFWLP